MIVGEEVTWRAKFGALVWVVDRSERTVTLDRNGYLFVLWLRDFLLAVFPLRSE